LWSPATASPANIRTIGTRLVVVVIGGGGGVVGVVVAAAVVATGRRLGGRGQHAQGTARMTADPVVQFTDGRAERLDAIDHARDGVSGPPIAVGGVVPRVFVGGGAVEGGKVGENLGEFYADEFGGSEELSSLSSLSSLSEEEEVVFVFVVAVVVVLLILILPHHAQKPHLHLPDRLRPVELLVDLAVFF